MHNKIKDYKYFLENSFFISYSNSYLEYLYNIYIYDKNLLDKCWIKYFDNNINKKDSIFYNEIKKNIINKVKNNTYESINRKDSININSIIKKIEKNYERYGHYYSNINPLEEPKAFDEKFPLYKSYLNIKYNFNEEDINIIKKCIADLKKIYTNKIGYEFNHIDNCHERNFIKKLIYSNYKKSFSINEKTKIIKELANAKALEKYIGYKFPGQKRFSLEGGEVLVPLLSYLFYKSSDYSIIENIVGMPHRGRLNILANVFGKPINKIIKDFTSPKKSSGDVKYHLGYSSQIKINNKIISISLADNPSHLELIDPVIMGIVRAKQDKIKIKNSILGIIIHGDSSISGQGVVMESFNMQNTNAFSVKGCIHIVVNNQIGFTTSKKCDTRSTEYCTSIGKMFDMPILHVNSNYPEEVLKCIDFALAYRQKFSKSILIDLVCYRLHGHNESDEPTGTQPLMYKKIKKIPNSFYFYYDTLKNDNIVDYNYIENIIKNLEKQENTKNNFYDIIQKKYSNNIIKKHSTVKINYQLIKNLSNIFNNFPKHFSIQKQVLNTINNRIKMTNRIIKCNWGYAEILLYAFLLHNNINIRISGQDSQRGTFSHRYSVLHDQVSGEEFIPLRKIKNNTQFFIYNSILSEEAVLGFEYGYSLENINGLNIWEAQFGDFSNGAQNIIDQFISSGYYKWGKKSNLVLLLPHGYDGMGPEHSSARIERFLQLSSNNNINIVYPTTAVQIFNILKDHVLSPIKIPLIIFFAKNLLKNKLSSSSINEIIDTSHFKNILINDNKNIKIEKIVICSGKIYYDIINNILDKNVLYIRLEQLYPFPKEELIKVHKQYKYIKRVIFCQEEPKNQGSWFFVKDKLKEIFLQNIYYVGRPDMPSTAEGNILLHNENKKNIFKELFLKLNFKETYNEKKN